MGSLTPGLRAIYGRKGATEMSRKSIGEILNSEPDEPVQEAQTEPAAVETPAAEEAAEAASGTPEVVTGEEGDTPQEDATPPVAEDANGPDAPSGEMVPIEALLDERRKRQELKQQLGERDNGQKKGEEEPPAFDPRRLFAPPQPGQVPGMPLPNGVQTPQPGNPGMQPQRQPVGVPPDPYADPDGYETWLQGYTTDVQQAERRQQEAEIRMEAWMDAREEMARGRYPDFEATVNNGFARAMTLDPSLGQRMLSATDPAEFAYQVGKQYLEFASNVLNPTQPQPNSNPSPPATETQKQNQAPAPGPESLSGARSVGEGTNVPAYTGPKPIGKVVGPR